MRMCRCVIPASVAWFSEIRSVVFLANQSERWEGRWLVGCSVILISIPLSLLLLLTTTASRNNRDSLSLMLSPTIHPTSQPAKQPDNSIRDALILLSLLCVVLFRAKSTWLLVPVVLLLLLAGNLPSASFHLHYPECQVGPWLDGCLARWTDRRPHFISNKVSTFSPLGELNVSLNHWIMNWDVLSLLFSRSTQMTPWSFTKNPGSMFSTKCSYCGPNNLPDRKVGGQQK